MTACTLYPSYCLVAASSCAQSVSVGYGTPFGSTACESISGPKKSSMLLPPEPWPLNDV